MVFGMFWAILIFDPNWPFCKGYTLCKMADFQNRLISRILGVFSRSFSHRTTLIWLEIRFPYVFGNFIFWHKLTIWQRYKGRKILKLSENGHFWRFCKEVDKAKWPKIADFGGGYVTHTKNIVVYSLWVSWFASIDSAIFVHFFYAKNGMKKTPDCPKIARFWKAVKMIIFGDFSKGLIRDCAIITSRGAWKMGEICPKAKSYPPLIKQKLISTSSQNDNIKANPLSLKKVSSHWFVPYLVYLLDFFLRYKHHFKWLFDVCQRVIWRVIKITGLWASLSSSH